MPEKKQKKRGFQTPTGMHDILPEDQRYYQKIYNVIENIAEFYGFEKIDTPILEEAELFVRGVGGATDIVEKQMFTLRTKGGDWLALRPEQTAAVARSYIQHGMQNLPQPVKFWHFGPYFRYEHPQSGRYREFRQFGFEVLGEQNPVIDAQTIQIFYNILKELKFKDLTIEVNSIGDSQCRPYFKKLLVSYFKHRENSLCPDCKRRLRDNPLRILDCKEEKCQRVKSQAPQIIDHLCEECHNHFKEVLEFLDELGLPYRLNPYLVRGLDYYTKTVFEIFSSEEEKKTKEEKAQTENSFSEGLSLVKNALVGGGRYDKLVKILGGRETPACGGAAGVERIIEAMKARSPLSPKSFQTKVFLSQLGNLAKRKSLKLFEEFYRENIPLAESFGRDSLKTQLRIADKLGVRYSLILGQKEALDGTVIIREMKTGRQETVKLDKVVREIKRKIKK